MATPAQVERLDSLSPDLSITLDELVLMVSYAERLAFFFARCNAPALRDRLIAAASRRLGDRGIQVVVADLSGDAANVREALRRRLARAANGQRSTLFVTGLEHSLPYDRDDAPLLSELNMGRELFHRDTPVPIVFWLPDYALTSIARSAPDFWAWRSGVFDFEMEAAFRQQAYQQYAVRDSDGLSLDNLTAEQKQQRRRILEGLLDEYENLQNDDAAEERIELLFRLAQIYQALYDLRHAIEFLERYLSAVRNRGHSSREGVALYSLGNALAELGKTLKAIEYYEEALAIAKQICSDSNKGSQNWWEGRRIESIALGNLGLVYADLGDRQRAKELLEQAQLISRMVGDKYNYSKWLDGLGGVYVHQKSKRAGLRCLRRALVIRQEIGDQLGVGMSLGNMGVAYGEFKDYQHAIEHHEQALAIFRELGDRGSEGAALANLAVDYQAMGNMERALELLKQDLSIQIELGNRRGTAMAFANLGGVYFDQGHLDEARSDWQDALAIFEAIESPYAATVRGWLEQLDAPDEDEP